MMGEYLLHSCDRNELDKRKKEAELLLQQGGLLCFLLNESFIDAHDGENFEGDDLTKHHLSYSDLYRENYNQRITRLHILRDEFRPFLEVYGAANTNFHHYIDSIEWHDIARTNTRAVGMIIGRLEYFVPTFSTG